MSDSQKKVFQRADLHTRVTNLVPKQKCETADDCRIGTKQEHWNDLNETPVKITAVFFQVSILPYRFGVGESIFLL